MEIPRFIRKFIVKAIGGEIPTAATTPFNRDAFQGFTEGEVDELVLGKSFGRINTLKKYLLTQIDASIADRAQRKALREIIGRAVDKFMHAEALDRTPHH